MQIYTNNYSILRPVQTAGQLRHRQGGASYQPLPSCCRGRTHGRRRAHARAWYYEAMQRFPRFLAEVFRLERLANIASKHIYAYITRLQEQGKSASTIKTNLSAIRFFHDRIQNPRYELPANNDIFPQRRTFGGVDRTWSDEEFKATPPFPTFDKKGVA